MLLRINPLALLRLTLLLASAIPIPAAENPDSSRAILVPLPDPPVRPDNFSSVSPLPAPKKIFAKALPTSDNLDLKRTLPVAPDEQIPVMDFFRPRLLQEPKLNPSGTHIAAIVTANEDRHQLLVYELSTKKGEMVGGPGDTDISEVSWLNDRRLVFQLAAEKLYSVGLFAANVGSLKEAYPLLQYFGSQVLAVPLKDPLHPLVWNVRDMLQSDRDQGVAVVNTDLHAGHFINLLKVNATSAGVDAALRDNAQHIERHFPLPKVGVTLAYMADKDGQLEFAVTAQDGVAALQRLVTAHWEKCPVDLENVSFIDTGEKPGELVVRGPRQEGKPRALQFMNATTGQLGEVLLQDDAYDFFGGGSGNGELFRDPETQKIVGAMFERNGPQMAWFDDSFRQLQKNLEKTFPGLAVRLISTNKEKSLFLVALYSDRQPVLYKWIDVANHQAGLIKNSAPWIDPQRMQPVQIIKYNTRDGHELDAYLTLPAGASKQNPPPLVVLPHGGPWVRDTWMFDGEAQFLASRGYAVLKPNYRGSNGYGWRFPIEDTWDFRKMHDDVTDATKALIASHLIDGTRIAIMGGSFGGYLALSGVVNEPELYRCAITIAGVFDWEQQIQNTRYFKNDDARYSSFLRHLGDPKKESAKFDRISPGRHVDQIRVPVFVSGGKSDQTVELNQSKRLITALEKYHVPHETLFVAEEGHGMRHLKNEVELYTRIEAFLNKYLKPVPPFVTTR